MSVSDRTVIHPAIVKTTVWQDEADTRAFAARLAGGLLALPHSGNALIELHGDLGAGKTTLARHLLQALGVSGRIKSPTYALLEPYQLHLPTGPLAVSHLDFYRLGDPQEWEDAGLRDLFAAPGLKLVEWPERVAALMPALHPAAKPSFSPADSSHTGVSGTGPCAAVASVPTSTRTPQAASAAGRPSSEPSVEPLSMTMTRRSASAAPSSASRPSTERRHSSVSSAPFQLTMTTAQVTARSGPPP